MEVQIRQQTQADASGIEALMAAVFGPDAMMRSVWRLRKNQPVDGLCLVAEGAGKLVGSLRFWFITLAGKRELLLGPLAVLPELQGKGVGRALVRQGLSIAGDSDCSLCLVSGEPDYYPRFGFVPAACGQLIWPGPVDQQRLQFKALKDGAIAALPSGPIAVLHDPQEAPRLVNIEPEQTLTIRDIS